MKTGDVWMNVVLAIAAVVAWAALYSMIKGDIVNGLSKCCVKCECERGK